MHFCPQEAAILMSLFAAVSGGSTWLGYYLRGLIWPNKHVHCEDTSDCEKEEGVQTTSPAE
ncbi:MAG: hypothetical protein HOE14_08360 [Gemmatimonadales bacterium]|jgi:hypothetical protein|nr:hypothetical protein [Gemmatimonadales bacterium]